MVAGKFDQGRGDRVKQDRVTPLRRYCVSDVIIFSKYFFHYHFKVSIICEEYIRYRNNGMYVSNQEIEKRAPGPKRPQVPRLGLSQQKCTISKLQ